MASGPIPRLHVVTDDEVLVRPGFVKTALAVMFAGAADLAFHVRGPRTTGARVYELAAELVKSGAGSGALLVLNDRVDVVLALRTPGGGGRPLGIHLGQRSLPLSATRALVGPTVLMGSSAHDPTEVEAAASQGAAYLFFGHVYSTPTHAGTTPAGIAGLKAAIAASGSAPVVAIGGVDTEGVGECTRAGAHGVAVLRGVWDATSPENAVRDYISALSLRPGGSVEGTRESADDHR